MNGLLKTFCLPLALATLLGGCVYRMPIQQGNYLDPETLDKVKAGMTRTQVRFLLGTPLTPVAFDNSRWDYDYFLKNRRLRTPVRGHATVYFQDDVVARIDSDVSKKLPTAIIERPVSSREP